MPVLDIAATDVVTAARRDPVSSVAQIMADENVGSVVIEEENLPIGIVTDRQMALALKDDPEVGHEHIDEVMTRDVSTIHEDTGLYQAIQTLGQHEVRRAPVVDDDGRLVGIISLDDIIYVLEEEFEEVGSIIAAQSPRA